MATTLHGGEKLTLPLTTCTVMTKRLIFRVLPEKTFAARSEENAEETVKLLIACSYSAGAHTNSLGCLSARKSIQYVSKTLIKLHYQSITIPKKYLGGYCSIGFITTLFQLS